MGDISAFEEKLHLPPIAKLYNGQGWQHKVVCEKNVVLVILAVVIFYASEFFRMSFIENMPVHYKLGAT